MLEHQEQELQNTDNKQTKKHLIKDLLQQVSVNTAEPPADDSEIVADFSRLFENLYGQMPEGKEILTGKSAIIPDKTHLEQIAQLINSLDRNQGQKVIAPDVTLDDARKWSYTPETIRQLHTLNCSGAAIMCTSVLKSMGLEAYTANPSGHVVTLVRSPSDTWFYVDARNGFVEEILDAEIARGPRMSLMKLSKRISGFELVPFYTSIQDAQNHFVNENNHALLEEMEKAENDQMRRCLNFSRELLGESFESGLSLPTITEKDRLSETDMWKQEERSANVDDNVNNSMRAFTTSLNQNVPALLSVLKNSKERRQLFQTFMKQPPEEVQEQLEDIRSVVTTPFGIPDEDFLAAHKLFWEGTVGIRDIDITRFNHQLDTLIQSAVS